MRFSLALNLLLKNMLLNFIIILQLCAVFAYGNVIVAINNDAYDCYNITAKFDEENTLLYMPQEPKLDTTWEYDRHPNYDNPQSAISRYGDRVESVKDYAVVYEDYSTRSYFYGTRTAEALRVQLKKGKWFSNQKSTDGIIDCVIIGDTSKFPIGSILDMECYKENISLREKFPVKFRIIGSIGEVAKVPTFSASSSEMTVDYIFEEYRSQKDSFIDTLFYRGARYQSRRDSEDLIIIFTEEIEGGYWDYCNDNSFVFLDDLSDEEVKSITQEMKNEANVATMASARNLSKKEATDKMLVYAPTSICFIVMGLAGILCVSLLNMINNKRAFKAYSISGMSFHQGMRIIFTYATMLILIAFTLFALLWVALIAAEILPWDSMAINSSNYLFLIGIAVIIYAVMGASSSTLLKKYIHNIKE